MYFYFYEDVKNNGDVIIQNIILQGTVVLMNQESGFWSNIMVQVLINCLVIDEWDKHFEPFLYSWEIYYSN